MNAPARTPICVGWLADLSAPARNRVFVAMRELTDRSLSEWEKARELQARPGERPAGSSFFDHVLRAELIDSFLTVLRVGGAPGEAATAALSTSRMVAAEHNARCPDDPVIRSGWVRDLDSGQPYATHLRAKIERCVGQIDLTAEAAQVVWSALWRQMDVLRDERDAAPSERRPLDKIEADIASLVGVVQSVRAAGDIVSEATMNEMLGEYGAAVKSPNA